jgi:hypothetical protein
MRKTLFLLAAAVLASGAAFATTRRSSAPTEQQDKWTLCAYFLPDGNTKKSYCTKAPVDQAQKDCDAKLKAQRIEGSCSCTDDAGFIGDRCK